MPKKRSTRKKQQPQTPQDSSAKKIKSIKKSLRIIEQWERDQERAQ